MLNRESRGGWQRSLPLPDLSRKIEGPLLAGYFSRGTLEKQYFHSACRVFNFTCYHTPTPPASPSSNSQDNSSPSDPGMEDCLNGPCPRGRGWGKSQFAQWLRTSRLRISKGKRRNLLESGWRGITYQNKSKSVFEGIF